MGWYPPSVRRSLVFVAAFVLARGARAADVNATPATLDAVLPTLAPGDTVHLAAGHYAHFSVTNMNGTPAQWITITSDVAQAAVVDADPGPCCNTIEISGSSYVAIENLLVDGHDVDGAFGVSASDGATPTHDIRIENDSFVNHHGSQQHDAISTKTPTWGWIIRHNSITDAGTGLYLGNSNGDDPFIGGLIEDNLVENPIGYCMEIKFQNPRPSVAGMPTSPVTTIIRDNVFIKNDDPSPDGDRPNLLVGGFPASGNGSQDRYEIYGNFFFHNPRESLMQASGRVTIHDNVFVDSAVKAIALQDQDLPLEQAFVYDNTIYGVPTGIDFASAAPQGDAVFGNLVFSANPIAGTISDQRDNLTDSVANAATYVNTPSTTLGSMDFYPKTGQCTGSAMDTSKVSADTDYAIDFNGTSRGSFTYRGAYAGSGANPGWTLQAGIKTATTSSGDGGAPGDASASADGSASDGGTEGGGGGCGCSVEPTRSASSWLLLALGALTWRRSRRR